MNFVKNKWNYLISLLREGFCPKELTLVITLSILTASFPIFGISTIIITTVALKYKLNLALFILISYSLEPIRFLLFIPFSNFGAYILGAPEQELSIQAIQTSFNSGIGGIIMFFTHQFKNALIGWIATIIPFSIPFYYLLKEILRFSIPKAKECTK